MEGEAPKGGQWTVAMPQDSYTDLEEKLARAQRERDEALEQQRATAEILGVISSLPADVQPVFDTIVRNFVSLCGGIMGAVYTFDGELGQRFLDSNHIRRPRRACRTMCG